MHRRGRRTLLLQLAVALFLLAASCSSSGPGSAAEFSVIGALEQLPANAVADGHAGLIVSVGDLDAIADQAGLTRPADPSDSDGLIDFFAPLVGAPGRGEPQRSHVELPMVFSMQVWDDADRFVDEMGFSPSEVTTFGYVYSKPAWSIPEVQFWVLGGVSANRDLPEVAPQVQLAGEGRGFASGEVRDPFYWLQEPLSMTERDGLVAMSSVTEHAVEWNRNADFGTLAEDPVLANIGRRLDEEAVVSALIATLVDASPPDGKAITWEVAHHGYGLGWVADDDVPRGVLVLAYDSQDEAKEHQAGLENWLMTTTVLGGDPVSEVFQVTSVEVRGHELVASVDFVNDRGPVGFAGLHSWLPIPLEAQAD